MPFVSTLPLRKLRAGKRRCCSTAVDASLVAAVVVPGVLYSVLRYSAMSEMKSGDGAMTGVGSSGRLVGAARSWLRVPEECESPVRAKQGVRSGARRAKERKPAADSGGADGKAKINGCSSRDSPAAPHLAFSAVC